MTFTNGTDNKWYNKFDFDVWLTRRLCGPMDKAPAYGAGDCRFESCLSQKFFILDKMSNEEKFDGQLLHMAQFTDGGVQESFLLFHS